MHAGGIPHPEGYELILKIPVDDGSISVQLENLLKHHHLDIRSDGITVILNRAKDPSYGTISGRIIHDFIGTALIFRKDKVEENLTHFIVEFSHQ